ncbi:MAG: hypothetical protein AOA66_0578 [Candidatus Bathyarchaeota archaeon BA2]|nr:MAG: hypothetical protein AOA66_0578 [Candidatus Bathyarchaeota archaeon BA2]
MEGAAISELSKCAHNMRAPKNLPKIINPNVI